jgi:flagellar FliL protein
VQSPARPEYPEFDGTNGGPHVAEETAAPEQVAEKAAKQSNMGLIIAIVLVSLISSAGGAGLTAYLVGRSIAKLAAPAQAAPANPEQEAAKKKEEALVEAVEHGGVVSLDPFVVNLADQDSARYLRIKVSLMLDNKNKVKEVSENQALTLKVKDVILQTLSRKTSHDLINEEGKNKLRAEIQDGIKLYFKDPKLTDVMFTEFVIQL